MEGRSDRIVRIKTVLARTGLSRSTIYRKINEGTFPRQVKISIHGAGWRESSINHWINELGDYVASGDATARLSKPAANSAKRELPDG